MSCGKCELGWVRVQSKGWGGRLYDAFVRCACNPAPQRPQPPKSRPRQRERVQASRVCLCGAAKREGLTLCLECYLALPVAIRQTLWEKGEASWRRGYAYAKRWLQRLARAPAEGESESLIASKK